MGKGPKGGTESETREHRFVSFREKADSIKIDPIRRTRKRVTDDSEQSSYFITAFNNWSELNISASFSEFEEKCSPYCQSFHQVLYHKDQIMALLEEYIKLEDQHSLESLLDLVTHFAHDLGPDFEPYFYNTLLLLVQLSSNDNISIVEWTFNCFAYLFKFLSRLLTTDLKPTYDVLAPILGKTQQKKHVARYAAESMSFLVRKCTGDSLTDIADHIILDVMTTRRAQFSKAAIDLFTNAMASSGNNLHSKTPPIISAVLNACAAQEDQEYSSDFASGLVASLLHHVRAESSSLLYAPVLEFVDNRCEKNLVLCTRLVFVLAGLRQGSRVNDWMAVYEQGIKVINVMGDSKDQHQTEDELMKASMNACISILQNADFRASSANHRKLLDSAFELYSAKNFLAFSDALMNQSQKAFKEFMRSYIDKYLKLYWNGNELSIALFLNHAHQLRLVENGSITFSAPLNIESSEFSKSIKQKVDALSKSNKLGSESELFSLWVYIQLYTFALSPEPIKDTLQGLLKRLQGVAVKEGLEHLRNAVLGKTLSLLSTFATSDLDDYMPGLKDKLACYRHSNIFLQGYLDMLNKLKASKKTISKAEADELIDLLKDGVRSSSADCRGLTLSISAILYDLTGTEVPRVVSTCQLVNQIPIDVSNARNLALHIRNAGTQFNATGTDVISDKLVPGFFFGLLTLRFKPAWDAVGETVEKISSKAPDDIWALAWKWLAYDEIETFGLFSGVEEFESVSKEFETKTHVFCTNLNNVSDTTTNTLQRYSRPDDCLKVETAESLEPAELPPFLRTRTLEVLSKVPRIAEQHAKYLVPYILRDDDDDLEDSKAVLSSTWSQNDRIALLDIFGQFTNAKSLYRADDVYQRYLYLLGSKVTKIQQKALTCILTFKDPVVRKYKDNLSNLLDDTQFKDELTNFVRRSGEDEGTIHQEDREEILPLVIRILFGRGQVAKAGGVKQGRRFAVINSLNNVEGQFVRMFVSLASENLDCQGFLKKSADGVFVIDKNHPALSMEEKHIRREHGFVTMMEDILKQMHGKVEVAVNEIMEPLIYSLYHSQVADLSQVDDTSLTSKSIRSIRNLGLKCLDMVFQYFEKVDWSKYFGTIYEQFIQPKLSNFGPDNVGQVSSLMRVISTLSTTSKLASLLTWDDFAIPKALFDCVNHDSVKDSVVELVIQTMDNIVELEASETRKKLIQVCAPVLLSRLAFLFERESDNKLMELESGILVKLLPESEVDEVVRQKLVSVSMAALDKSTSQIRISVKASILKVLTGLLDERCTEEEVVSIYTTLSKLFKQFSDRTARANLAELYDTFGERSDKLARAGELVLELNAFSRKRLGLPDFDRRLAAFSKINENVYAELSPLEWLPILYNMLFFIKDPEELALRTGASYSLKRFIDAISMKQTAEEAQPYVDILDEVIIPALKLGLRDTTELYRFEFIDILGHLVKGCQWYHGLDDMKCLLFQGDDEANFFYNISHVQVHRRQRAVRRLGGFASRGQLKDTSIAHYLLPIIEHFVTDTSGEGHNLSTESVRAIGILCRHLSWNQYRAITKRYVGYVNNRKEYMKVNIKLIDTVADALSEPFDASKHNNEEGENDSTMDEDAVEGAVNLAENLPNTDKLSNFIIDDIVPKMQAVLSSRKQEDEDTLTIRIPLAIPIVKFIKVLPDDLIEVRLPGVLTGFCQILRAKSQELRDMLRRSLGTIAGILGAKYLVFIIRELKGALRRGTQLHVLGYTVHYLLTEMTDVLKHGDLDDSVGLISEIMMEDIFGVTGSEKDEENYRTQMKEVKHTKSFDNGSLLARNISLSKFGSIIEPIKAILLYEKLTAQIERKIEELLFRVSEGLHHNEEIADQKVLKMCHELFEIIENVHKEEEERKAREVENFKDQHQKEVDEHFTVTLDSRHWEERSGELHVQNLHVLKKFILDALYTVFKRTESLMTPENVMGFIPYIESGLYANFEDVQIGALRLLTFVCTLKLPNMDEKYKAYGRHTLNLIKSCSETNSELCQSSLKMLAALIRQKEGFSMKDSALAYVLQRIKPDLEEPNKQGVTFRFIKAVLSRKIVMSEVYDVMDRIAQVMITNQSGVIQDSCRSAYFQFLTEYPQGQGRLNKQLQFLVSNLNYSASNGRLSVMKMINLLVTKVSNDQIDEFSSTFFAALVLVIVKDSETQCRKAAADIIGEILSGASESQRKQMENYCIKWISNDEKPALVRGGMQAAGIYFTQVTPKRDHNRELLKLCEDKIMESMKKGKSDSQETVDWQVLYSSLQLLTKIVDVHTTRAFSSEYESMWTLVENTLLYPHTWVRAVASRLMGKLYAQVGDNNNKAANISVVQPKNLQTTAFKFVRQLGASGLNDDDGLQLVKNLVFISRKWEEHNTLFQNPKKGHEQDSEPESDEEDEGAALPEQKMALDWLVQKVSSVLRNEKRAEERKASKQSAIQFLAGVIQLVTKDRLKDLSYTLIMAFYPLQTSEEEKHAEFKDLCSEALKMLEDKLGTSDFLNDYAKVREAIQARRVQRKTKRSIMAVTDPELYAKRKLKKHMHERQKRKQIKDESGYYHGKKKKRS